VKAKQRIHLALVLGFLAVSLGGFLLHVRAHQPAEGPVNWVPVLFSLIGTLGLSLMFWFRATIPYAFVLNGIFVIVGMITMGHLALAHPPASQTLAGWTTGSTLAYILILLANLGIGRAIFDLAILRSESDPGRHGHFWRYPNMGWWYVHVATLSAVYLLGHYLWT